MPAAVASQFPNKRQMGSIIIVACDDATSQF
jgi:hypothetical protein